MFRNKRWGLGVWTGRNARSCRAMSTAAEREESTLLVSNDFCLKNNASHSQNLALTVLFEPKSRHNDQHESTKPRCHLRGATFGGGGVGGLGISVWG